MREPKQEVPLLLYTDQFRMGSAGLYVVEASELQLPPLQFPASITLHSPRSGDNLLFSQVRTNTLPNGDIESVWYYNRSHDLEICIFND